MTRAGYPSVTSWMGLRGLPISLPVFFFHRPSA